MAERISTWAIPALSGTLNVGMGVLFLWLLSLGVGSGDAWWGTCLTWNRYGEGVPEVLFSVFVIGVGVASVCFADFFVRSRLRSRREGRVMGNVTRDGEKEKPGRIQ